VLKCQTICFAKKSLGTPPARPSSTASNATTPPHHHTTTPPHHHTTTPPHHHHHHHHHHHQAQLRDLHRLRLHRRRSDPPSTERPANRPLLVIRQAIKEWISDDGRDLNWFNQERNLIGAEPECFDQTTVSALLSFFLSALVILSSRRLRGLPTKSKFLAVIIQFLVLGSFGKLLAKILFKIICSFYSPVLPILVFFQQLNMSSR
jgi:hypothetical protein